MHFYVPNPSDPDWLAEAAEFHGHLGPWVTVGAMIGHDALQRLETPGQWEIEVICWMPPEKQCRPFSCILDGLQVSTGATMGKQNIRFDFDPQLVGNEQPAVYVIRRPHGEHGSCGFVYHMKDALTALMARIVPGQLEEISREIADHQVKELLAVRPLTGEELASARSRIAAPDDHTHHHH